VILLWGVPGDDPLDCVHAALERTGAAVRLLDQRGNAEMRVELTVGADGNVCGTISDSLGEIDLSCVGAAYVRPLDTGKACGIEATTDPAFVRAMAVDAALIAWADLSGAYVVNRPQAMAANNSKPYQLAQIAGFGFAVPDTLVTTDAIAVREFRKRHGRVIYKSVSGVRSIVSQLDDEESALADVANCPTQFQEYIPGVDVRVHVVGDEILSVRIVSGADDYRYASRAGCEVEMEPIDLPAEVSERCRAMAVGMGLHLAGIDLRQRAADDWYCLEVNPSPGFTYYEAVTGQPISEAVAELLVRQDVFSRQLSPEANC
jgi:glutathione synthase/RimK-type ligase-like ATP-grasp enzyme